MQVFNMVKGEDGRYRFGSLVSLSGRQVRLAAGGAVLVGGEMFTGLANATGVDFTSLTAAVDFTTATAAVLLVFAALAGVAIAFKGGKIILRALGFSA